MVKAQGSVRHNLDIGNNGVLGFKRLRSNSESLLRVFLSLRAPKHFHTENFSFENNIPLSHGKRPVINGAN